MTCKFKRGDKVKLSGANVNFANESFIYASKVLAAYMGRVIEVAGQSCYVEWYSVNGIRIARFFYSPIDLVHASIVNSEDYLKDKDML